MTTTETEAYKQAVLEDAAKSRAVLTGIPHYVLANSTESWIAGQAARDNFWSDLVPVVSFNARGERI